MEIKSPDICDPFTMKADIVGTDTKLFSAMVLTANDFWLLQFLRVGFCFQLVFVFVLFIRFIIYIFVTSFNVATGKFAFD